MKKYIGELSNGDRFKYRGEIFRMIGVRNDTSYLAICIRTGVTSTIFDMDNDLKVKVVKEQKEVVKVLLSTLGRSELFIYKKARLQVLGRYPNGVMMCLVLIPHKKFMNGNYMCPRQYSEGEVVDIEPTELVVRDNPEPTFQ